MIDRRKFPRYNCSYDVDYYTYGLLSSNGSGVAEDVSKGGMRISVSNALKRGDVLRINISPSKESPSISARGKVRWVQKAEDPSLLNLDAGIEFVSIEPDDIDKLLRVI